jgi:hypothetical protein
MVELVLAKDVVGVRFPLPAPGKDITKVVFFLFEIKNTRT